MKLELPIIGIRKSHIQPLHSPVNTTAADAFHMPGAVLGMNKREISVLVDLVLMGRRKQNELLK